MKSFPFFFRNSNIKLVPVLLILISISLLWISPALSEINLQPRFQPTAFDLNSVENELGNMLEAWKEPAFQIDDVLVRHVSYFIKYYTVANVEKSNIIIQRSEKYLYYIKYIFRKYKIPEEIAFALPFVESGFNSGAKSNAGAVGMFQFIAGTAACYGLKIDGNGRDDRRDFKKASLACAKYLANNRRVFASNVLSLASYHHGTKTVTDVLLTYGDEPGRKFGPIFKNKTLGPFSREYIPQCLAAALIYRYLKKNHLKALVVPKFDAKIFGSKTSVKSISKKFPHRYKLNPDIQLTKSIYPYVSSNGYVLLTQLEYPALSAEMVRSYPDWAQNPVPQKSGGTKIPGLPKTIHYLVQTHNNVSGIAAIFGVSLKALRFNNRFLVKQGLHAGDLLEIKGMAPTTQIIDGKSTVCDQPLVIRTLEKETLDTLCKRVVKTIRSTCTNCKYKMGSDVTPALIYYWNQDVIGYIQPDTLLEENLNLIIYSDYRWHKTAAGE